MQGCTAQMVQQPLVQIAPILTFASTPVLVCSLDVCSHQQQSLVRAQDKGIVCVTALDTIYISVEKEDLCEKVFGCAGCVQQLMARAQGPDHTAALASQTLDTVMQTAASRGALPQGKGQGPTAGAP